MEDGLKSGSGAGAERKALADRIQARAVRRMGELLKQFDGRGYHMKKDGAVLSLTQKQIADAADRLESALSLVDSEYKLAHQSADRRMLMSIGASWIRTDR